MKKIKIAVLTICVVVLSITTGCEWRETVELRRQLSDMEMEASFLGQKFENAEERARQWEEMYKDSLFEIAHLKSENEELTRRWEEVSFAYGEVCEETGWTHSGEFVITHYCSCPKCCGQNADGVTASGTAAVEGRTVAVDPSVIPMGSEVMILGKIYKAEDTGSAVKGNHVDIYIDDHDEAAQMGTYTTTVSWR